MSAHTPGPWTALEFPDEKFVEVRANEGYSIVAHVFFNNGNRDETARLIVAAPELLEACQAARALTPDGTHTAGVLDAAIAKAMGGAA